MAECSIVRPSHQSLIDDEIAALALQLEELNTYSETSKGKYAIDRAPSIEIAYASFQAELQNYRTFLSDIQLAQSIATAVHTDSALIADITTEEIRAQEDRNVAIQISTNDPEVQSPPPSFQTGACVTVNDWMFSMNGYFDHDDEETIAGPSMSYAERQAKALGKFAETSQCTACTEDFPLGRMVAGKCNHRYCIACMKSLFMRSTKDESVFPPKCCKQPIAIGVISSHLSPEEMATFELKSEEFSTSDRLYCSSVICGDFISPRMITAGTNRGVCTTCFTSTCSLCQKAYHKSTDCPEDPAIQQTRDLARGKNWQTCPRCKRIVEMSTGCYHIICLCKAEFCYLCARKWKSCSCVSADMHRIEGSAAAVEQRPVAIERRPWHAVGISRTGANGLLDEDDWLEDTLVGQNDFRW